MEQKVLTKPLTYLDRGNGEKQNYIFVSYSHKDCERVYSLLSALYECGVNYWYDKELDPGDKWNSRVEGVIRDASCVGAIVFLSDASYESEAVAEEIKILVELRNHQDFRLIAIRNEDFENNRYNSICWKRSFDDKYEEYCWSYDTNLIEEIHRISLKENFNTQYEVTTRGSYFTKLNYIEKCGKYSAFLGKYPFNDHTSIQPIEWMYICQDRQKNHYLVSKYCIDFVPLNNIKETIKRILDSIEPKYKNCIENIDVINLDFLQMYKDKIGYTLPTDYADSNRNQFLRSFWVCDKNSKYHLYNSLNVMLPDGINYNKINAGIRLLLIINDEELGGNNNARQSN